jgi:hypothetical protein
MWEEKYNKNFEQLIKELLKYTSEKGIRYSPRTQLLISEMIALSNQKLEYDLILKSLIKLQRKNSIDDFKLVYKNIHVEHKKVQPKSWKIFLPYKNLLIKRKFKILGTEFKIINIKNFKAQVDISNLILESNKTYKYRVTKFELPKYFIELNITGNNLFSCWSNIKNVFSILQGVYDYGTLRGSWIETEVEMTSFLHPEWILGIDDKGSFNFSTFLIYGQNRFKGDKSNKIKTVNETLNFVSQITSEDSTKSLIYESLRLYAQAMESVYKQNTFLNLWQIIENGCISDAFNGSTKEVVKRIRVITKETKVFDIEIEGLYMSLSQKRNELVHKGIDTINNHDINILKIISEAVIQWLFEKEKELKTKVHIREYFQLLTKNKKDRAAILETVRLLNAKEKA